MKVIAYEYINTHFAISKHVYNHQAVHCILKLTANSYIKKKTVLYLCTLDIPFWLFGIQLLTHDLKYVIIFDPMLHLKAHRHNQSVKSYMSNISFQ